MMAKRALLVGVGDYLQDSGLRNLRSPRKDVDALQRVLSDPDCGFRVTPQFNPKSQEIKGELEALFADEKGEAELALFYFSGHGKLDPSGELFLCAGDTLEKRPMSTTVALSEVRRFINATRAKQVVVILDCCYSGAAQGTFKGGEVATAISNNLGGEGRGRYLITSSTAIQPSMELEKYETSLFTTFLVEGIGGAADSNNDNIITIEELYRYVEAEMLREFPQQSPKNLVIGTMGDVVIARKGNASGPAAPLEPMRQDHVLAIKPLLAEGLVIPFLGAGIYGSGPLSLFDLAAELAKTTGLTKPDPDPLVTAAEYVERYLGDDRSELLRRFRKILSGQSKRIERSATHDFIAGLNTPWLVVSSTYDMVLERRLEEAKLDYAIVAHILRSRDNQKNGQILMVRPGQNEKPKICPADQLLLTEEDRRVIYKVLGSPLLHDSAPAELELDTVVLTETDYMEFLGNVQHQETKVPDAFNLPFRNRCFLFLGYNLDLWNYRLLGRLFKQPKRKRLYAVRQPASLIEEVFWNRFDAELIPSDPNNFVRSLGITESGG